MVEMLLQSHAGEIGFLPALPKAWPEGSIKGIRARGAVEIDLSWRAGKASLAVLRAAVDGEHKLRPPRGQQIDSVSESGRKLPFAAGVDGLVPLKVLAKKEYQLTFR